MANMKATLTDRPQTFSKFHARESGFYREYRVLDLETLTVPVSARLYYPAKDVFCVLHAGLHRKGSGRADGGGYHKASAALGYAIHNAGIDLSENIDGVGDAAMDKAMLAIAAALGVKHAYLILVNA